MLRQSLERMIRAIERAAGMFLLLVTAITFIDVVFRYLISRSLPDAYDFSSLLLGVVVFWGAASASFRREHIKVDLFANMLGGHIALKVFAGFVAMLGVSLGAVGWVGGVLPLAFTVALTALEILVAFLQAYVFAILTVIYLNDALHPGH